MPVEPLKLKGLVAPVFTPFRADGSLDLAVVEKQAEHLVRQGGVVGVFVAGTTGEGASLTVQERRLLTERWVAVAGGRLPVVVHVGHDCLAEAKGLAAHAERAGAAAVAAVVPYYYEYRKVMDVVACCAEIAAAAPGLPFYYYHIPGNTGVRINVTEFLVGAEGRIPTLAGLKFSEEDLIAFGRTVDAYGEHYDLFFGVDELLLPALSVGAKAAIGSTYNFAAPLYTRMIDSFRRGDVEGARTFNEQARLLAATMRNVGGGIPAMKAAMRWAGVDCGPCRLPLRTLAGQDVELLEGILLEDYSSFIRPARSAAP